MTHYLSLALAFLAAHWLVLSYLAVCVFVALSPERWRRAQWFGMVVKGFDFLSVLAHKDSAGTLKLPFVPSPLSAPIESLAKAIEQKAEQSAHGNPGFASVRTLQWISGVLIVGALSMMAAIAFHGCSAATSWQHLSPEQRAHIGVNGATHVLRDVDTAFATQYTHEAVPGANLDVQEHRFAAALASEQLAYSLLQSAEYAIDHHDLCAARGLIAHGMVEATNTVALASSLGVHVDLAASAQTITQLGSVLQSLAPTCADGGL